VSSILYHNIRSLASADWDGFIVPGIPIAPHINDDENIRATARFVKSCDLEMVDIPPFHRLGESKYRQPG
jgi:pyruvate-formate lyase-activating enzyme